jgi:hypothetical protein
MIALTRSVAWGYCAYFGSEAPAIFLLSGAVSLIFFSL